MDTTRYALFDPGQTYNTDFFFLPTINFESYGLTYKHITGKFELNERSKMSSHGSCSFNIHGH